MTSAKGVGDLVMTWVGRLALTFGLLNLVWEVLQLPLYSIWSTAPLVESAYAVIHCTGGDILIGATIGLLIGAGSGCRARAEFDGCFRRASLF